MAHDAVVPGELLAELADAAEATGLDEERPQDVARVLRGGPLAAPAALRLAKRLHGLEQGTGATEVSGAASRPPSDEPRVNASNDGPGGSAS